MPAARCRPRLARQSTHVRARPQPCRAVSLVQRASIGQKPTPTSAARTHRKRALLRLPQRNEHERWQYYCLRTCARKLLVGNRGRHVGARPCTEGEGRLAGAVGFHRAGADSNQRGAHTPQARVLRLLQRERACAVAFLFRSHAQGSYLLEAAAGTSERGRAPRQSAVSLAQWASIGQERSPTSTARRAHAASARAAPSPERERARAVALFLAHMRKKAACWKPRLARRSAAVHRGRGPPRWCRGLP